MFRFRLSALLGKGLYFAGDVCTIEVRPEGVPGIPSDPTGSKHKALCTRPAWYWITMPGAGATALFQKIEKLSAKTGEFSCFEENRGSIFGFRLDSL